MVPGTGSPLAADRLTTEIGRHLSEDPRGPRVSALLAGYAREATDWRGFLLWDEDEYTRNVVARTPRFELLLLCWSAGQASPIHDHEGQSCWMAVLEGRVEEVRFERPSGPPRPLRESVRRVYGPGEVAFIRDEMGPHEVRPSGGARAASLHLYAAPYTSCTVYDRATGRIERRRLADHSYRGRRGAAVPRA